MSTQYRIETKIVQVVSRIHEKLSLKLQTIKTSLSNSNPQWDIIIRCVGRRSKISFKHGSYHFNT